MKSQTYVGVTCYIVTGCENLSFCVKCSVEDTNIVDGLCINCFLEGKKLVDMPNHVNLLKCVNCGRYLIKCQWIENAENEVIVDIALDSVKVIPTAEIISAKSIIEKQEERTFFVTIQVNLGIRGSTRSDESSTIVRIKNSICERCSKQLGNYYEATIQIRSGEKKSSKDMCDRAVEWIKNSVETRAKTDPQLFISKIQQVSGGTDVYLSSVSLGKSIAHKISNKYGVRVKESASLFKTLSDGREVHRVTFLVRMPTHQIGDIILYYDHVYKLDSIGQTGIQATDISNFNKFFIKKSKLSGVKNIKDVKDITEAVVISASDREIQVLHPRNYSICDIRVPENSKISEKVRVVEVNEELFYIP